MSAQAILYAHDARIHVAETPVAAFPYRVSVDDGEGRGELHLSAQAAEALARQLEGLLCLRDVDAASDTFHQHALAETREENL